jgi:hypothetical protein
MQLGMSLFFEKMNYLINASLVIVVVCFMAFAAWFTHKLSCMGFYGTCTEIWREEMKMNKKKAGK